MKLGLTQENISVRFGTGVEIYETILEEVN